MKRSDVTRNRFEWQLGENNAIYKTPSPILYCISFLGENIGGQGYWVSQNCEMTIVKYFFIKWHSPNKIIRSPLIHKEMYLYDKCTGPVWNHFINWEWITEYSINFNPEPTKREYGNFKALLSGKKLVFKHQDLQMLARHNFKWVKI